MLMHVCKDVEIEPQLQELTGEILNLKTSNKNDDARLDVAARGFWSRGTMAFSDIRIFNPMANCYSNKTLDAAHRQNECEKKRAYNQRVLEVEHGSFTPLVFSCFGGMSLECSSFYKRLDILWAEKLDQPYSEVCSYIKTRICFSLLRVAIMCIRGSRVTRTKEYEEITEIDIRSVVDDAKLMK